MSPTSLLFSKTSALCVPEGFKETPGHTKIFEHNIVLKEKAAVRRMSYRIPEHLLVSLKKEVDLMLSLSIIKVSRSEGLIPLS